MRFLFVFFSVALMSNANANANSESGDYYVGFGFVSSTAEITPFDVNALHPSEGANPAQASTINNGATGFRLFAGWKVLRNLALEVAMIEPGNFSYIGTVALDNGSYDETVSPSIISVSFNAKIPISTHNSLFVKAGVHRTSSVVTYQYTGDTNPNANRSEIMNEGLVVGFGYEYLINQNFGLKLERDEFYRALGQHSWGASTTNLTVVYYY